MLRPSPSLRLRPLELMTERVSVALPTRYNASRLVCWEKKKNTVHFTLMANFTRWSQSIRERVACSSKQEVSYRYQPCTPKSGRRSWCLYRLTMSGLRPPPPRAAACKLGGSVVGAAPTRSWDSRKRMRLSSSSRWARRLAISRMIASVLPPPMTPIAVAARTRSALPSLLLLAELAYPHVRSTKVAN